MEQLIYQKPERVLLKERPEFDEKWVQARIAEDPKILGLGDVVMKDRERAQPKGGRLDLLLQDIETNHRYEVELQLGQTDETHIIRTIEYWDVERKRFPQYEHSAVLVAEDITSRFLNVIELLNGAIPLVAIQLNAVRLGNIISLVFTTVIDERSFGLVDEDEEVAEVTDRTYWENRATKETVQLADRLLETIRTFEPRASLKYNKFYIGLTVGNRANNFVSFIPQKAAIRLELKLARSDEIDEILKDSGVDTLGYDRQWGQYRLRLTPGDLENSSPTLGRLNEESTPTRIGVIGEAAGGKQTVEKNSYQVHTSRMTNKQIVEDLLQRIPEEASLHDIAREIEFIAAVRQGLTELDRGERIPIEEVERELPSWIIR